MIIKRRCFPRTDKMNESLHLKIEILQEPSPANPFIILKKPRGLPSAPLFEHDDSAFTQASELFPELLQVNGKKQIEHGLVHRIDTETEGLLVIASTQESYDNLVESQNNNLFIKEYTAQCDNRSMNPANGYPPLPSTLADVLKSTGDLITVSVASQFRPYGNKNMQVRPVTESSGMAARKNAANALYTTSVSIKQGKDITAVCSISKGYRHQVRCHLAWIGFPVKGDKLYNLNYIEGEHLLFVANKCMFPHPLTGKPLIFEL